MSAILLVPRTVDLALYAGDGATVRLTLRSPQGDPVALDGEVEAQIRTTRGDAAVLEAFAVDASAAADGVAVLSLTGAQTAGLVNGSGSFAGAYDVQWTAPGAEPATLIQGAVSCAQDVTR